MLFHRYSKISPRDITKTIMESKINLVSKNKREINDANDSKPNLKYRIFNNKNLARRFSIIRHKIIQNYQTCSFFGKKIE